MCTIDEYTALGCFAPAVTLHSTLWAVAREGGPGAPEYPMCFISL